MTASSRTARRLASAFDERIGQLAGRLDTFGQVATVENVHDLRTALRRYQATERLLPKKMRNSHVHRDFMRTSKEVFRSTTPVRDLDVIARRLEGATDPGVVALASSLKQGRIALVRTARAAAKSLLGREPPSVHRSDLSEKRCRRRGGKVEAGLKALARKELEETLSSERNQAAHHRLRKTCKELRYTLEVTNPDGGAGEIDRLERFQELLGAIHDLDISDAFFRGRRLPGIATLLAENAKKRHRLYVAFCDFARAGGIYPSEERRETQDA